MPCAEEDVAARGCTILDPYSDREPLIPALVGIRRCNPGHASALGALRAPPIWGWARCARHQFGVGGVGGRAERATNLVLARGARPQCVIVALFPSVIII